MNQIPRLMFLSRVRAALFCCTLLCIHDVLCENLRCEEKHIANNLDLNGLYDSEVCVRESEGQNLTSSDCTVWDFAVGNDNDYDDCKNLLFSSDSGGDMPNVQVYPYVKDEHPNLNITFRNIEWHYMQYQQQVNGEKSCQKLQLRQSVDVQRELRLSFACGWWGYDFRGHDAQVLLNVGESPSHITAYAQLLLKIPEDIARVDEREANITNWIILVVVDVARKPNLVVHWPAVPEKFGVTHYNVQLGDSKPEMVDMSSCPGGYCTRPLFAGYASRNVSVSVQPVHKNCPAASCRSFTPDIKLEFTFPVYFIVLIVLAFILCFLIIICSVYYNCCAAPKESPALLILFDATELRHCRVVRILAEYLKTVASIHCWLADSEVPFTESKNASKWLHKAFSEADAVLIVASPMVHPEKRYSLYPNVLDEALPLIAKRRMCPAESESRGRYLVAIPPYCSAEDIPTGLEDLPRLHLPLHLSFLVWSVYNQRSWWPSLACTAKAYLQACWCPGPTSAYRKYGRELHDALRVAGAFQTVVEEPPRTPGSNTGTDWTLKKSGNHEDDTVSMPYKEFPGYLNGYSLLEHSIISEESATPKIVVVIDDLPLG